MGAHLRFTPDGPRDLDDDADFRSDDKPKVIANPENQVLRSKASFDPVVDPIGHAEVLAELDRRGATQRGKPRSRDPRNNPLGGRIFDCNCGWPLYRIPDKSGFRYTCGCYTQRRGCSHNRVDGQNAIRIVLGAIRQRVLAPTAIDRLRVRLKELATAESRNDEFAQRRAGMEGALAAAKAERDLIGRNLARSASEDQYRIIAAAFEEAEAKVRRLSKEIEAAQPAPSIDPNTEVESALALLDRLSELGAANELEIARDLFGLVNARLFLRFEVVQPKKRRLNVVSSGTVTLGAAPFPVELYKGPTGKRGRLEFSSPTAIQTSPLGLEGCSSGNCNRGDMI